MKYDKINTVSNEAVERATGKSWDQWIRTLDRAGAAKLNHAQIADLLRKKQWITNGWWCQMVTVGYEYAKGRRVLGETADQGFEVGVQKTLPLSKAATWKLLTSSPGLALWLGKGVRGPLKKGKLLQTTAGSGEVRTLRAGERVRLTWQPRGRKTATTLQMTVGSTSRGGVHVRFHQEKLASQAERELRRKHWQRVLDQVAALVAS